MQFKDIQFVQFGLLTDFEIKRLAVLQITKPYINGGSFEGTVYSELMGVLENGRQCQTCGQPNSICPGHIGYIQLPEPIYNPKCLRVITNILKCICLNCAGPRILPHETKIKYPAVDKASGAPRFKMLVEKCDGVHTCPNPECANLPDDERVLQQIEFKQKDLIINRYLDKKNAILFTAKECLSVFLRISNDTMKFLGFGDKLAPNPVFSSYEYLLTEDAFHVHQIRPEAMIFTALPVIPPASRTWVIRDGVKCSDDLTEMYNTIVKLTNEYNDLLESLESGTLAKKTNASAERSMKEKVNRIQSTIYVMIDNKLVPTKTIAGKQIKSMRERVQGKQGHVVQNVTAKRTDFSARTVITADPTIKIGQLSIPKEVAESQTRPVLVVQSPYEDGLNNVKEMQALVDDRKANYVIRNGKAHCLKHLARPMKVQHGDIVERHLRDGDWILFNRQPTLRKESILAKQIVVRKNGEQTFGVPLAVKDAFNCDQ